MNKLKDKVAVITGASKGIGAGIARALAAEGASVVVNYASSREDAQRVVGDIVGKGGKAIGKLDVLVNNAGVYEFAPLEQITAEQFHRQFDTNVLGLLLATQEAARHFNGEG